ncbi:MAG: hypothetical protein R2911_09510 [Caldilineaceae bacterium]
MWPAQGFRRVVEKHGRHAVYGIASGRTPSRGQLRHAKFMRADFA